jgi:hypothetical protein
VVEVGADHLGLKGSRVLILKDKHDDVIADVSLALQLLLFVGKVRQHSADMEHDFKITPLGIERTISTAISCEKMLVPSRSNKCYKLNLTLNIETAVVLGPAFELDFFSQHIQKLVKIFAAVHY